MDNAYCIGHNDWSEATKDMRMVSEAKQPNVHERKAKLERMIHWRQMKRSTQILDIDKLIRIVLFLSCLVGAFIFAPFFGVWLV